MSTYLDPVTTPEVLDALPVGTHGIDRVCAPVWRQVDGWYAFLAGVVNQRRPVLPVVVLHVPAPSADNRCAVALARNIVDQVLEGAVERGGYRLVDMTARQRFNDVADRFVADLIREVVPCAAPALAVADGGSSVVAVPGLPTRELVLHDGGRVSWRDALGYDIAAERAVLDETPEVSHG